MPLQIVWSSWILPHIIHNDVRRFQLRAGPRRNWLNGLMQGVFHILLKPWSQRYFPSYKNCMSLLAMWWMKWLLKLVTRFCVFLWPTVHSTQLNWLKHRLKGHITANTHEFNLRHTRGLRWWLLSIGLLLSSMCKTRSRTTTGRLMDTSVREFTFHILQWPEDDPNEESSSEEDITSDSEADSDNDLMADDELIFCMFYNSIFVFFILYPKKFILYPYSIFFNATVLAFHLPGVSLLALLPCLYMYTAATVSPLFILYLATSSFAWL